MGRSCGLSLVVGSNPIAGSRCRRSSMVEQPPKGVIPRHSLAHRFFREEWRDDSNANPNHGGLMADNTQDESNFEITSKRRKGFPSETQVKRGVRVVHGNKELSEKLGRNDLCPCGSGHRFYELLPTLRPLRRQSEKPLFSANSPNSISAGRRTWVIAVNEKPHVHQLARSSTNAIVPRVGGAFR